MDGDFKGDFTRDTFHPWKHFSRVLMQQGRVQLDADWNEQADILTRYLRDLAADLIGPFGGPGNSFQIGQLKDKDGKEIVSQNFSIQQGHYYVDGILCENDVLVTYVAQDAFTAQPDFTPSDNDQLKNPGTVYLVYLDVWERQVTYLEDELIREVALGENRPDTSTRAQVVWQVKIINNADFHDESIIEIIQTPDPTRRAVLIEQVSQRLKNLFQPVPRGMLRARAKIDTEQEPDACITPPDSQYRGDENQLYRVEIHHGGLPNTEKGTRATFKWSRDNGSIVFPITSQPEHDDKNTTVTVANLGRDDRLTVEQGDWVEIVDENYTLQGRADPLLKVSKVDRTDPLNIVLTLEGVASYTVSMDRHPILRRWDQRARAAKKGGEPDLFDAQSGIIKLVEGQGEGKDETHWITLEDGVQIQFQLSDPKQPTMYRPGDYWLIPARTITGDVEWPLLTVNPVEHKPLPPHGIEHHYAPLAIITLDGNGNVQEQNNGIINLRYTFKPLVELST